MYTDNFEEQFWQEQLLEIQQKKLDFKFHQLPLTRIKKVMKTDQDVKMISAEAPILFSKGCELFITELNLRAWEYAVKNKRRTLQEFDIAAALAKSDMFDFLIDIVPREEAATTNKQTLPPQQQNYHTNFVDGYGNYGYVLPPGTQFNDSDTTLHHQSHQQQYQYQHYQHYQQQQQQQQFYMQEQLLNQKICDTRQRPN
ncbi:hypothetical protein MFLAVUS_003716 [Mucor flavus]|uniref:Core Histone H2A/H2B/H3 domain-containing protein n=1 Tax=Mucor flavus TaxID=439312 RepID=A0ABP9YTV5_9FUNG